MDSNKGKGYQRTKEKDSLDIIQKNLLDENYSQKSLKRLSNVLKGINAEVDMLSSMMDVIRDKDK